MTDISARADQRCQCTTCISIYSDTLTFEQTESDTFTGWAQTSNPGVHLSTRWHETPAGPRPPGMMAMLREFTVNTRNENFVDGTTVGFQ
jgi:hypothetical protein